MVHDTVKLSGVILLRISIRPAVALALGREKERHIMRGSRGFLQNVPIEYESINPSEYLQKGSALGCVHTCVGYNVRKYIAFSAGVDLHFFFLSRDVTTCWSCMKKSEEAIIAVDELL